MKYYSVVTFGDSPKQKVFRNLDKAKREAYSAIGIGSCTCSRVYECDNLTLAKTADISELREGERIVAQN